MSFPFLLFITSLENAPVFARFSSLPEKAKTQLLLRGVIIIKGSYGLNVSELTTPGFSRWQHMRNRYVASTSCRCRGTAQENTSAAFL